MWFMELMRYRKSYLSDMECLIALGGSQGTNDEITAARELNNVRVFPVPCFGGIAMQEWKGLSDSEQGPCKSCSQKDGQCSPTMIKAITKHLMGCRQ
jgi:hypothetical protein